ncbi:MAG: hypothetical protein U9R37_02705 [Campylobacterota bacterium]|nr:hypothetical protein [Campylobacterota bacterium]
MKKNILTKLSSLTLIVTLFTACGYKEVEVYQNGDELLNCNKITTKIADLIDINKDINDRTGFDETSLAAWVFWPPYGLYNEIKGVNAKNRLDERFEYLIVLKNKNGCNLTNKEKMFLRYKGRVYGN